ncbi:alpha-1, 2-mannosyltransferase/rhamnosyltransferase [Gammaproteobacteria bacterium]
MIQLLGSFKNQTLLSLAEIHNFNQLARDRWVHSKAVSVPVGKRVLDIGAGTCLYRPLFAHCDYKTHDFKEYHGNEKHGSTSEYGQIDYVSDIIEIPVPDHSFDVILCTEVIEHTREPIKVMKEISRILRPGGRVFVTAPLGCGLHQMPYHFYGGYTPEWYKHFGIAFGLYPVEITPNGGFFKHLAQECARAASIWAGQSQFHGSDAVEIYTLLHERLPRFFFVLDDECFVDKFTVGYFVEYVKKAVETSGLNKHDERDRSLLKNIISGQNQSGKKSQSKEESRCNKELGSENREMQNSNIIDQVDQVDLHAVLRNKKIWNSNQPLRLHLGCGEQHLDGYVNIDYPSENHSIMRPFVDYEADIKELNCAAGVVDEIRLHHVFEHFNRVLALNLLARWHHWLKMGGYLRIETPDLMGNAQLLISDIKPQTKLAIVRHLVGDQSDSWAYHVDQWYEERFRITLIRLGFKITSIKSWHWPHEPYLANIEVIAQKSTERTLDDQFQAAKELLRDAMVSETEQATYEVWVKQLTALFSDFVCNNKQDDLNHVFFDTEKADNDTACTQLEKNSDSIIVKLMGGLGNQMFQFAAGLSLARKHAVRLKLDISFLNDKTARGFTQRDYSLDAFYLVPECETILSLDASSVPPVRYVEKDFRFDPAFFYLPVNTHLEGYWQSPKYFESIKAELLGAFGLRTGLPPAREALANKIRLDTSICVHVRRGDMVHNAITHAFHGSCGLGYYQAACTLLARRFPDAHFYIFSDEPDWCRSVDLVNGNSCTIVSDGRSPAEDLYLMGLCRHFVIANSSLSWWAAYLGEHEHKFVIAPAPWFDNLSTDTSDLIPDNWIRLSKSPGAVPTEKNRAPLVSVVIPCYNQANYLPEAVASVANQTFSDWEIIIVNDGSPDNTSEVMHSLAATYPEKQFVLLVKANGGLSSARDAGMRVARGRFLLPLDADDQLAPSFLKETVAILIQHPEIAVVYTDIQCFGNSTEVIPTREFGLNIMQQNGIAYCALFRREVWEVIGGYNPNMSIGYEDWDFWVSAVERRFQGYHIPKNLFLYHVRAQSMISTAQQRHLDLFARIVLNHPQIYDSTSCRVAEELLQANPLPPPKSGTVSISVVIPFYKQVHYFPEAVESVVTQTCDDWEIIIVDEDSPSAASIVVSQLMETYPGRITLIEKIRGTLSSLRNTGIRAARGEYIFLMNASDRIKETMLRRTMAILDECQDVGFAYTDIQYVGVQNDVLPLSDFDLDALVFGENIVCTGVLVRKTAWLKVGGYNEDMRDDCTDRDFWIRCVGNGWRGYCVHEPLSYCRRPAQSMSTGTNHKHGPTRSLDAIGIVAESERLILAGRNEEAMSLYQSWLENNISLAAYAIYFNLGVCQLNSGRYGDAEASFQQALSLNPEFIQAKAALELIIHQAKLKDSDSIDNSQPIAVGYSFCIITNGKRPHELNQEIDSILALGIQNSEILVGGEAPAEFSRPGIRVLDISDAARNGRLGEMRNVLCRAAQYNHLIVADDDLLFHQDFYEGLQAFGDNYDVLCVRLLNPDGTRFWDWATHGGPSGHRLLRYDEVDPHVYVTGGLCVMKANVFKQVQWDDGRGFYQGEDLDFSSRLTIAGFRIQLCPNSTVTHNDNNYTQSGDIVIRLGSINQAILGTYKEDCSTEGSRQLVDPVIKATIPVIFDISTLGVGLIHDRARTGIYRVVDNILKELIERTDIQLNLVAQDDYFYHSIQFVRSCQNLSHRYDVLDYLSIPANHLFHLPFDPLPASSRSGPRVLTVYDLIPIKFPHFFESGVGASIRYRLASLGTDDFITVISEATKADLCELFSHIDPNKIVVTPLAADSKLFYPCLDPEEKHRVTEKYQLGTACSYLLSVATLEPRKNTPHLIRAFVRLLREDGITDLKLVLVGTKGWKFDEIFHELSLTSEISNRIVLTGFVPDTDMAALYSNAMAFAYLSLYEGFGLPPLEAMQCGTPVITSDNSSLPEVVGDAGILLPAQDEDALVDAIRSLYRNDQLRRDLSRRGIARAAGFTWERCVEQTVATYRMALAHWQSKPLAARTDAKPTERPMVIDAVCFQMSQTGIARVWRSLLSEWVVTDFGRRLIVLDRAGTAPRLEGLRYIDVPRYDFDSAADDRAMLQRVCDEENAALFVSSYYTTPMTTPSVLMIHDMIPELFEYDPTNSLCRDRHIGVLRAGYFMAVSQNTAKDLCHRFQNIPTENVSVVYCGVNFKRTEGKVAATFRKAIGIKRPYFLIVGSRNGYKNSIIFFKAFSEFGDARSRYAIVCAGSNLELEAEFKPYIGGATVHMLHLNDDDLQAAYSGAIALIFPSRYEGFGLPAVEAMACGCPVITAHTGSIPEVADNAVLYVDVDDVKGMARALKDIQNSATRDRLISLGLKRASQFSWHKMADEVRLALERAIVKTSRDRNLRLATQHHNGGQLRRAEAIYRRLLDETPNDFEVLHMFGAACSQRGELTQAQRLLEQALSINGSVPQVHFHLGSVYAALGRAADASQCFANFQNIAINMALQHHQAGQLEQAEALYRQILEVIPNDFAALHMLGVVCSQRDDFVQAELLWSQAVTAGSIVPETHYNLAIVHNKQGRLNLAHERASTALRLNPDFESARQLLAAINHAMTEHAGLTM